MRKLYFALLLLSNFISHSQIVTIPDANFKNALLNHDPVIDTNEDGEIQVAEASSVVYLDIFDSNISSVEGIQNFISLQSLNCGENQITSLEISQLTALKMLWCFDNLLTSLDLSNQPMEYLWANNNLLSSLTFGVLPNECAIEIADNQLTTLSIIEPNKTIFLLDISNNPLIDFNLDVNRLYYFNCNNTALTTLDLSLIRPWGLANDHSISNNPNLQFINFKNGYFDYCIPEPENDCNDIQVTVNNNPNLQSICVDNGVEETFFQDLLPDVMVTTYCSLSPVGPNNILSGTISLECAVANIPASNIVLAVLGPDIDGFTYTNSEGFYSLFGGGGSYTVAPQFGNNYFSVSPPSFTYTFPYNNAETQVADFCVTPNGVHPDLEIAILPLTTAQPGFDASYRLTYKNKGTPTQSGTVSFTFDDSVIDFVAATPSAQSQINDTVTWDFMNLQSFETRIIEVTVNVNSPMENPAVQNGDILPFEAMLSTSEIDETPDNNTFNFNQVVVGSFDPNDKTVLEGTQISPSQTDEYLHYLIRFQNSGTAPAVNIVVKDMIASNLDISTLQILSASHPMRSTLTEGNKLEFFFENINLPDETTNEPASHGFVAFKIKPASTVGLGSVMENTAEIYFDYNFPILTNTVSTTVTALGVPQFSDREPVIHPNPAKDTFSISHSLEEISKIVIYNVLGQQVESFSNREQHFGEFDIAHLNDGTYFVKIHFAKGSSTIKLVKI